MLSLADFSCRRLTRILSTPASSILLPAFLLPHPYRAGFWRDRVGIAVFLIVLFAPNFSHAQEALAEVFASDATVRGGVVLAGSGTKVLSGSSISAGSHAAVVRLNRGGEVRVCPGNSVTLASATGREMLWGVGTGAIEVHYGLASSADTLMTPDFRILLAGPGAFHFALSSDNRGNTCVRTLPGNSASVIVQELAGGGSYQVRPGDQVLFRNGTTSEVDSTTPLSCGCPAPPAVHRAEKEAAKPEPEKTASKKEEPPVAEKAPAEKPAPPPAAVTVAIAPAPAVSTPVEDAPANIRRESPLAGLPPPSPGEVTAPLPAQPPGEIQVQVDAPFVFQAAEPIPETAPLIARVSLSTLPQLPAFNTIVLPPPAPPPPPQEAAATPPPKPKKKGGFFGFFRALFGGLFGKK